MQRTGLWVVVLRIYVAAVLFQPYHDLEAGDNQSLNFEWRGGESNPGPLVPQAKGLISTLCKYQNDLATTGLRNGSFLANKPI